MSRSEIINDVRVNVITGAGKGFCAGADMGMLSSIVGGGERGNGAGDLVTGK